MVRFDLSSDTREVTAGPHDFLGNFLEDGKPSEASLGRPVAVMTLPGGTAYISDDKSGVIYKLQYQSIQ